MTETFPQKVTKQANKKKLLRSRPASKPTEPAEPVVEYWRFAGGDVLHLMAESETPATPTRVLGLARVSVWMLETFETGMKQAVEQYGEMQNLMTQESRMVSTERW